MVGHREKAVGIGFDAQITGPVNIVTLRDKVRRPLA
jgi:hypothetical protein